MKFFNRENVSLEFQVKFQVSHSYSKLRVIGRGSPQLLISEPRGHGRATDANESGRHAEKKAVAAARREIASQSRLVCIIITGVFELALTFTDTLARALSLSRMTVDVHTSARFAPRRAIFVT